MDDNLKQLMQELGTAINNALAESVPLNDAIQNVRNAGYNVYLVLEATIGFNKREEETAGQDESESSVRLRVTPQDLKFLKSLKISSENLDSPD